MLLLLTLIACGPSPAELAIGACEVVPGLHVDAAGQALAWDFIDPAELQRWRDDLYDYGPGIEAIGLGGYGVIRSNSSCTVQSIEGQTVKLLRSEPDLDQLQPFVTEDVFELPRVERALSLQLVDTDRGLRAQVGLEKARADAALAWDLAEQGELDAGVVAIQALGTWFPDPMLRWEIEAMRERQRQVDAQRSLTLVVEPPFLWLLNDGEQLLEPGLVHLRCGDERFERGRPDLAPGERVAITVDDEVQPEGCAVVLPASR